MTHDEVISLNNFHNNMEKGVQNSINLKILRNKHDFLKVNKGMISVYNTCINWL